MAVSCARSLDRVFLEEARDHRRVEICPHSAVDGPVREVNHPAVSVVEHIARSSPWPRVKVPRQPGHPSRVHARRRVEPFVEVRTLPSFAKVPATKSRLRLVSDRPADAMPSTIQSDPIVYMREKAQRHRPASRPLKKPLGRSFSVTISSSCIYASNPFARHCLGRSVLAPRTSRVCPICPIYDRGHCDLFWRWPWNCATSNIFWLSPRSGISRGQRPRSVSVSRRLVKQIKDLEREVERRAVPSLGPWRGAYRGRHKAFLAGVKEMPLIAERASMAARRAVRGETGSLRVGFTATATFNIVVPSAIRTFRRAYPEVYLTLEEANTTRLVVGLREEGSMSCSACGRSTPGAERATQLRRLLG